MGHEKMAVFIIFSWIFHQDWRRKIGVISPYAEQVEAV
jgi:hypothetical protein